MIKLQIKSVHNCDKMIKKFLLNLKRLSVTLSALSILCKTSTNTLRPTDIAADRVLCLWPIYGWLGITIWYTTTLLNTFILYLCTFVLLTDCLSFCYFTTFWPQWTISLFLLKFFWCRPLFPRVFADTCRLAGNVTSRFWSLGSFIRESLTCLGI